jgi:hypothetical protein
MSDDTEDRSTTPPTRPPSELPPDPAAYDSERSAAARRRGLAAPYIPGGRDPDQANAEREDRRYLRILLAQPVILLKTRLQPPDLTGQAHRRRQRLRRHRAGLHSMFGHFAPIRLARCPPGCLAACFGHCVRM